MGVHHPPYNFGGLPEEYIDYEKARVVVLPVPFGLSTSWQSGTEQGPRALIEASGYLELYDIETGYEVHEVGIHTDAPVQASDPEELNDKLQARVEAALGHADRKTFVNSGTSGGLVLATMALVDPGDEVIVFDP